MSVQGMMFFVRFRIGTLLEHSPHFILKSFEEVDVLIHCDFGLPYTGKDFTEDAVLHHNFHGP